MSTIYVLPGTYPESTPSQSSNISSITHDIVITCDAGYSDFVREFDRSGEVDDGNVILFGDAVVALVELKPTHCVCSSTL